MKMVKTFIKTQHQHVMPPEKGKKEVKENVQSKSINPATCQSDGCSGSQTQLWNVLEDEGRCQDSIQYKAQHNPSPLCVFL